ncbi:hypothetical protein [Vibrio sp.]|uniref:hypothetical protein n=1 Tax=Vibrio sp. TaxID=678 RepID=UPI003D0B5DA8
MQIAAIYWSNLLVGVVKIGIKIAKILSVSGLVIEECGAVGKKKPPLTMAAGVFYGAFTFTAVTAV